MYTVTRNTKNNSTNKNLVIVFDEQVYIPLRSAKILCGYSDSTANSVILKKVNKRNIKKMITFTKKETEIEKLFLTVEGFTELVNNIKQKDKKQNGEIAIAMIHEIQYEKFSNFKSIQETPEEHLNEFNVEIPEKDYMSDEDLIDNIINLVGVYNEDTKPRWKALYDKLDESLDESIRRSWQRYKRETGRNITILSYIRNETKLLPMLNNIAINMFNN